MKETCGQYKSEIREGKMVGCDGNGHRITGPCQSGLFYRDKCNCAQFRPQESQSTQLSRNDNG
jgi:hypothetical protein